MRSLINKRDDKPGYVADGHLSRPAVTSRLKQPTWNWRAAICSCAVLLRMGFTYAPSVAGRAVVSYTALPPLPRGRNRLSGTLSAAVHFCCTVPGVTSAGRYPASCPVKPGLSSPGPFRLSGSGRLSHLRAIIYHTPCTVSRGAEKAHQQYFSVNLSRSIAVSNIKCTSTDKLSYQ